MFSTQCNGYTIFPTHASRFSTWHFVRALASLRIQRFISSPGMETQYCLQSRVGRGDQKPEYGSISTNKISSILEKGNENEEMNAGVPSSAGEAVATSVVEHKTGSSSSSDASGGQFFFWVPGWAYLVLFVLLYSANNAVLSGLMARG